MKSVKAGVERSFLSIILIVLGLFLGCGSPPEGPLGGIPAVPAPPVPGKGPGHKGTKKPKLVSPFPEDVRPVSADIGVVGKFVTDMLAKGYTANQLLGVFDIDGTITNHSDHRGTKVPERPGATKVVKDLHTLGVRLVFASAHLPFSESLDKLRHFKLETEANIVGKTGGTPGLAATFKKRDGSGTVTRNYTMEGNVLYSGERKAFAAHVALTAAELAVIKILFFVDDRGYVVDNFRQDLAELEFPNYKFDNVVFFPLTWLP